VVLNEIITDVKVPSDITAVGDLLFHTLDHSGWGVSDVVEHFKLDPNEVSTFAELHMFAIHAGLVADIVAWLRSGAPGARV
jgi:hypothetical protein